MEQLLFTIPECCRLAAIGRTKFYELIKVGKLKTVKIGRLRKVTPEAIDALIASLTE